MQKTKVLFFAEAVTLAHVARPYVLARSLDSQKYDVSFASDQSFNFLFENSTVRRHKITSLEPEKFLASLRSGEWLYTSEVLKGYVEQDKQLIHEIQPDIIVGDMRYSLGISAPLCRVPYVSICNAYWSPFAQNGKIDVPCYDFVRTLGLTLSRVLWRYSKPLLLRRVLKQFNSVRTYYGLPVIDSFAEAFTYGDRTFYADVPELVPTSSLPPHHSYGGALYWSPELDLPSWWSDWRDQNVPLLYITPGSSGDIPRLPELLKALCELPVQILFAAGDREMKNFPGESRVLRVVDYAPGDLLAKLATIVISNGGSPTSYQALSHGTPVLGICSNFDQFLAMSHVERRGAGVMFRSDALKTAELCLQVRKILHGSHHSYIARQIAEEIARHNVHTAFHDLLHELNPSASSEENEMFLEGNVSNV